MNGSSPKEKVLSIENVEFIENDSNKRRSRKKKKKSKSGSNELVVLGAPPEMPLYQDDKGETNPLLQTNPSSGGYGMPQQYGQPYYPAPDYYGGVYDYGGYQQGQQQPPSPPQPYPPPAMMNMSPNAMYHQYYDPMGASMYHPIPGQQQIPTPQSQQHSPYDASGQRLVRSPPSAGQQKRQQQGRRSTPSSPPPEQIRKAYPVAAVPDGGGGGVDPLKRAPQVEGGTEEYEIPLRGGSTQKLAYGAIPDSTTPPRSSHSKASKPPRRKSDILGQRPPSPLMRSHRRVSSDGKFGRHRRTNSDKGYPIDSELADGKHRRSSSDRLPPAGLGRIRRSLNPFPSNRRRSYSGGASPGVKRPSHVRASSLSEASLGASIATSTSMVSHVTDISKSAFFGGTTESGKVQLHFPFENVRLTMDDALPTGVLYMRHVDEEQYEDYHILNDEHSVPWELDGELPCQCVCEKCLGCTERNMQLAPSHYIMTVEDDLYRRIFDEISASRTIPCGLFYCGHHEDVSHPSIVIAGTIVLLVFVALAVAAIMTSA